MPIRCCDNGSCFDAIYCSAAPALATAAKISADRCATTLQADALTLSTVVLLQHVVKTADKERRRPLHVVGMVRRQETVDVCNYVIGAPRLAPTLDAPRKLVCLMTRP